LLTADSHDDALVAYLEGESEYILLNSHWCLLYSHSFRHRNDLCRAERPFSTVRMKDKSLEVGHLFEILEGERLLRQVQSVNSNEKKCTQFSLSMLTCAFADCVVCKTAPFVRRKDSHNT
jgi:hypothetical protein